MKRKRKLVVLLILSFKVTINVLWLFLNVVGLQCVIVLFPDHMHLLIMNYFLLLLLIQKGLLSLTSESTCTKSTAKSSFSKKKNGLVNIIIAND